MEQYARLPTRLSGIRQINDQVEESVMDDRSPELPFSSFLHE